MCRRFPDVNEFVQRVEAETRDWANYSNMNRRQTAIRRRLLILYFYDWLRRFAWERPARNRTPAEPQWDTVVADLGRVVGQWATGCNLLQDALTAAAAAVRVSNDRLGEVDDRYKLLVTGRRLLDEMMPDYDGMSSGGANAVDAAGRLLTRLYVWNQGDLDPLRCWLYFVHGRYISENQAAVDVRRLRTEVFPNLFPLCPDGC